jgi:hypothetical protein
MILSANVSISRFVCFEQGLLKLRGSYNERRVSVKVVVTLGFTILIVDK